MKTGKMGKEVAASIIPKASTYDEI